MTAIHKSVLLNEVLELSGADNARLMFDMNLGEGGHTFSFLNKYPQLKVIGVDADEKMTVGLTDGHSGARGGAQKMSFVNEPG